MTKRRPDDRRIDRVPAAGVGFDDAELRGGDHASRIARALGIALKRASISREEIARQMSGLLNQRISKAMLDAYAAEAKTGHQITLERFLALIRVTGCVDLLGLVAEPFDHVVIPAHYAAIIELHEIEREERALAQRKAELLRQQEARS